ncbi:MAG: transporter associated domain-containing protein [Haliea sp.]
MIVREKEILNPIESGSLQAGDYVYLLAPPERVPRLDRLFEESPDVARRLEPLFGELSFLGDTKLADIADLYNLEISQEHTGLTVASFFELNLKNPPQPGSRLKIGNAVLVVRTVENGRVERAGLQLDELIDMIIDDLSERSVRFRVTEAMRRLSNTLRRLFVRIARRRNREQRSGDDGSHAV